MFNNREYFKKRGARPGIFGAIDAPKLKMLFSLESTGHRLKCNLLLPVWEKARSRPPRLRHRVVQGGPPSTFSTLSHRFHAADLAHPMTLTRTERGVDNVAVAVLRDHPLAASQSYFVDDSIQTLDIATAMGLDCLIGQAQHCFSSRDSNGLLTLIERRSRP